jgi:AcrR family transcriptional regulator
MENEVLEHATRLFAERGFAGTSLQDIATSMGLKRPALYYYFKSKEELLERLIVEAVSDPAQQLREIASRQDLDAAERLHAMTRWNTTWVLNHTDRFLLLVKSESELSPATAEAFNASRRKATDVVIDVIEEGIATGLFRSVDATTAALSVFGISNWAAWWFSPDGRDSIDHVANQIADMAVAGLKRSEHGAVSTLSPHAALSVLRADIDRLERALDQTRSLGPV